MKNLPVIYHLDTADRITAVNSAWDDFARANGWPAPSDAIIGRPLWDFISGAEVISLWRTLFEVVRGGRSSCRIPFRCDSPELRRDMSLEIVPSSDYMLECRATTLQTQPHLRTPLAPSYASDLSPHEFVRLCSWCKKMHVADDWIDLAAGIHELQLFEIYQMPVLSHGICPGCRDNMLANLDG